MDQTNQPAKGINKCGQESIQLPSQVDHVILGMVYQLTLDLLKWFETKNIYNRHIYIYLTYSLKNTSDEHIYVFIYIYICIALNDSQNSE